METFAAHALEQYTQAKQARDDELAQQQQSEAASKRLKTTNKESAISLPQVVLGPPALPATEDADDAARELQPYPFFYYVNRSRDPDPDSLTPLTQPGRVPNFPAKMHSILSRPDLADVIAWLPHGRSWRVLKPREFEVRVIPTYFEHAKFSSFIRQANG
jgi:hypothetical protein